MSRFTYAIIAVAVLSAIILFSPFPESIIAQDGEILEIRKRISELEERVMKLENLLIVCKEPQSNVSSTGQAWQDKKNWRILKSGMSAEQVQAILGEPTKTIEGVRTLWYYPNIYCGYVSFDQQGRLTTWKEP
jgi:outer membrane protein assembly factor BamE (lipoprotein component of BamABCDE complex)